MKLTANEKQLRDALLNMRGAFDNAVRRMKYPDTPFIKDCIDSMRDALRDTAEAAGEDPNSY